MATMKTLNGYGFDAQALGGKTLAEIMLGIYPVGAVYISVNNTSPASLFGGTWERLQDRFLLAAGSTYRAGSTGGEAEHTLTIDEIPAHYHIFPYKVDWGSRTGGLNPGQAMLVDGTIYDTGSGGYTGKWHPYHTQYTGGDEAHNNMPPYLAVYMWKRVS